MVGRAKVAKGEAGEQAGGAASGLAGWVVVGRGWVEKERRTALSALAAHCTALL